VYPLLQCNMEHTVNRLPDYSCLWFTVSSRFTVASRLQLW